MSVEYQEYRVEGDAVVNASGEIEYDGLNDRTADIIARLMTWLSISDHNLAAAQKQLNTFERYIHVNACSDEGGHFAFFTPKGAQDEHEGFDLRVNGCESEEEAIRELVQRAAEAMKFVELHCACPEPRVINLEVAGCGLCDKPLA